LALFYPIIYPTTFLPKRFQKILALNPMAGLIEGFRACLFPNHHLDWTLIGTSAAVTLVVLVVGALYSAKRSGLLPISFRRNNLSRERQNRL